MTESELSWFEAKRSADLAQTDLNLVCTRCGARVCTIEHRDSLLSLASAALDHKCLGSKKARRQAHDFENCAKPGCVVCWEDLDDD